MATDWAADVKKYAPSADDAAIAGIVRHCGIALRSQDSALVAFSDAKELDRVRNNFLKKKLGLTQSDKVLDAAIAKVGETMKADRTKNRVTVYYLLADAFGKLGTFAKAPAKKAAAPAAKAAPAKKAATPTVKTAEPAKKAAAPAAKAAPAKKAAAPAAKAAPATKAAAPKKAAKLTAKTAPAKKAAAPKGLLDKAAGAGVAVAAGTVAAAGAGAAAVTNAAGSVLMTAADTTAKVADAAAGAVGAAATGAAALATGTADKAASVVSGESDSGLGWLWWLIGLSITAFVLWWLLG